MTLLPLCPPVKTHPRPSAPSAEKSVAELGLWIEADSVLSVSCKLLFVLSGLCDAIGLRNLGLTRLDSSTRIIPKSYSFYTKVAKSAKELTASNSFFADLATFV